MSLLSTAPPAAGRSTDPTVTVLTALFALVPSAFLGIVVGPAQITGLAWLAGLVLTVPLAVLTPVPDRAMRRLAPYLGFAAVAVLSLSWSTAGLRGVATLVQLLAPVPAFVVATRVREPERALAPAARLCTAAVVAGGALGLLGTAGLLPSAAPLSARPLVIALVPLFVVATLRVSRRRVALLGAVSVLTAVVTGGRTGAAVLLVVVLLSPSWRLGARGRAALALLGLVAVLAFSTTQAFRERFFFTEDGTLVDALTGSSTLNTAGRRELWPLLVGECSDTPWLGRGVGSGSRLAADLTLGVLVQPHDDYLRIWCDTGLVGSGLFWGFFVTAGASGLVAARAGSRVGAGAGQLVTALLLLAVTDNVVIYTAYFMVPLAVVLGCAVSDEQRLRRRPARAA